jgi:Cu2+-exporting ATPase
MIDEGRRTNEYMISLFPNPGARNFLGAGQSLWKRNPARLIDALSEPAKEPVSPLRNGLSHLYQTVKTQLAQVDERYQQLVQVHVDPLLGKTRHSQLQEMVGDAAVTLHPDEARANRRFGLGVLSLGLALAGQWVFTPLMPVAIGVGLVATSAKYPIAYQMWQENKRIGGIHLLLVYSLAMWLGGYAAAGALGSVLFGLMLKIRALTELRSQDNLIHMFQLQPDKVWVRTDGGEVEIPFSQVGIGDTIVLYGGQVVPVDGTILAGVATIDQHMLTGESQPVEKKVGDPVLASTLVISGQIDVRVEKTSKETTAGQIAEILNRTAEGSQPILLKGIESLDDMVIPTVVLSAVSWPFIGPAGAISLLGANSMFTSYLSSSLAMLNFLNLAARSGILIKAANGLEELGQIDTVVFDKTGTLTEEVPTVAQVHSVGQLPVDEVLRLAAAAEARQTHPIARAILRAAAAQDLQLPAIDEAHYEVGYGLAVRLHLDDAHLARLHTLRTAVGVPSAGDGLVLRTPRIRVGSGRFMAMEGVDLPPQTQTLLERCQAQGHSLVMVAVDEVLVGAIELQPTVRPEARQIVEGLRQRGLDLYIISGDQEAPTQRLAQDLGVTGYFANTLPEAKADLVAQLQAQKRRVCFIGDGINDAIAMRQAEVSISLRGATTVATDTAQIILMEGNLHQLLELFRLAEEYNHNLKQNVRFTTGVTVVATSGILFAGLTFLAAEISYSLALFGGLAIAMQPLLARRK